MERCGAAGFRPNRPCRPLACDVRARTFRDVCPKVCSPTGSERSGPGSVGSCSGGMGAIASRKPARSRHRAWKGSVEVTADGPMRPEQPLRDLLVRQDRRASAKVSHSRGRETVEGVVTC